MDKREIKIEFVVFHADNFTIEVDLPNDIKFYEFCRFNDKQRFYVAICKNDSDFYTTLCKKSCFRCNRWIFGDYMILELRQCHPVEENLPLITLEELNQQFDQHIKNFYIKSERISKRNKEKNSLFTIFQPTRFGYYTESIAKPLGFVNKTGDDLSMKMAIIQKYSWLGDDFHNHVHRFEVGIFSLKRLMDEDTYKGQVITVSNTKDLEEEYNEEVKDLLDMDNFNYIDFREE